MVLIYLYSHLAMTGRECAMVSVLTLMGYREHRCGPYLPVLTPGKGVLHGLGLSFQLIPAIIQCRL